MELELLTLIKPYLSDAMTSTLGQWLMLIGVVWRVMGKKVARKFKELEERVFSTFKGHFDAVEKSMKDMVTGMKELETTVKTGLDSHSQRLTNIEDTVLDLKTRVTSLETTKEK